MFLLTTFRFSHHLKDETGLTHLKSVQTDAAVRHYTLLPASQPGNKNMQVRSEQKTQQYIPCRRIMPGSDLFLAAGCDEVDVLGFIRQSEGNHRVFILAIFSYLPGHQTHTARSNLLIQPFIKTC